VSSGWIGGATMVPWYHGTMVPWYHHGTMVPPWWERWAVLGSKALTKAILGLTRREITEHRSQGSTAGGPAH